MKTNKMNALELLDILSDTLRDLNSQEVKESNRNFNRQCAKAKEIGNIAGKMIALTAQQLYAIELGAQINVDLLGVNELSTSGMPKLMNKAIVKTIK
jgi:hypothetical protein